MPRVHFVKSARKARKEHGIKKGDSYYWWATRTTVGKSYVGRKHYSKTPPKPSQLTSSEFLRQVYSLQEEIESAMNVDTMEDVRALVDDWCSQIEEIRSELDDKFNNLPEGFQQGSTGELLQERMEAMDNWISELQGVDLPDPEEEPSTKKKKAHEEWEEECEEAVETALEELRSISPEV